MQCTFICLIHFTVTEVTLGLQQTAYTVTEDDSTAFLCAEIILGSIAGRTITIDYETTDNGAEGEDDSC